MGFRRVGSRGWSSATAWKVKPRSNRDHGARTPAAHACLAFISTTPQCRGLNVARLPLLHIAWEPGMNFSPVVRAARVSAIVDVIVYDPLHMALQPRPLRGKRPRVKATRRGGFGGRARRRRIIVFELSVARATLEGVAGQSERTEPTLIVRACSIWPVHGNPTSTRSVHTVRRYPTTARSSPAIGRCRNLKRNGRSRSAAQL
jgi:hypothetical protein